MKTILAIGFLFFVAGMVRGDVDQQVVNSIREHLDSCTKELQITQGNANTPEEEEAFIKNESLDDETKAKDGCFKACLLKHLNVLEDGVVKPENIQSATEMVYSHAPEMIPQKVEAMIRCSEKVAGITDECELAYELINCVK